MKEPEKGKRVVLAISPKLQLLLKQEQERMAKVHGIKVTLTSLLRKAIETTFKQGR